MGFVDEFEKQADMESTVHKCNSIGGYDNVSSVTANKRENNVKPLNDNLKINLSN